MQTIRTLTIDETSLALTEADCTLYIGRLNLDFECSQGCGSLANLPFGDAVEFSSLLGVNIEIRDCQSVEYENPVFKPCFNLEGDYYSLTSLRVAPLQLDPRHHTVLINSRFRCRRRNLHAGHQEVSREISVSLRAHCQRIPVDATYMLMQQQTLPIRFANRYLPLLGIARLPDTPTSHAIINLFGQPDDQGGGNHPKFGDIQHWIRYTLPNCFLRFQIESDTITHVTVMPKI